MTGAMYIKRCSRLLAMAVMMLLATACNTTGKENPDAMQRGDTKMHRSEKRGVSFDFRRMDDAMLLSEHVAWYYNWGPDCSSPTVDDYFEIDSVVFMPMAWNAGYNAARITQYVQAHPECKYLLAYNEPNLTDQANMTPAKAAESWSALRALAQAMGLKLVSPAMNYGTLSGYSDPIKWLDEFFAQPDVSLDDVDAIAIHCYMSSPSALESYVERFKKYGKSIWLTEFCAWDPAPSNVDTQMDFMCAALNFLEQDEMVGRYAWFMPRAGMAVDKTPFMQLLTHTTPSELTDLGKMFCAFSTFDKSVWLDSRRGVAAKDYVATCHNNIQIRPSTEAEGEMMVTNLRTQEWLEYQVYVPAGSKEVSFTYATVLNSLLFVEVDGQLLSVLDLPKIGSMSNWSTISGAINIKHGRHTVRLQVGDGTLNFAKFSIK